MIDKDERRALIAKRIAQEINNDDVVNLGIGIPTLVPKYIPKDKNVWFQSENGIIGMDVPPKKGEEDPYLTNAGGGPVTARVDASFIDSATSFAIIRGGHLTMTVLGALQVDQEGSIANWIIPGKLVPGMGGAMDLLSGAKKVVAAFEHTDKHGHSKILKKCTFPLSAYKKLTYIITDMAFIEVTDHGLLLQEVAYWTNVEEVKKATNADLIIPKYVGTWR